MLEVVVGQELLALEEHRNSGPVRVIAGLPGHRSVGLPNGLVVAAGRRRRAIIARIADINRDYGRR